MNFKSVFYMNKPNLHIFNPSCETAIANGTVSYIPNKTLLDFENDLAYLPSILSSNDDLILMHKYEELSHLDQLHALSFPIAGQILQKDFFEEHQKIITEIEQYKLWGNAPNWIHRLKKNTTVLAEMFQKSPFYFWAEEHKELYSRKTAMQILKSILKNNNSSIYVSAESTPTVFDKVENIDAYLTKHKQIVLKEPWSSSGRGVIMLRKSSLNQSIIQRIKSVVKQQRYIMAEPMLDKKLDLAMHFKIVKKQVEFIGDTYFSTNSNGQYQANYLNQYPDASIEVLEFLKSNLEQLKSDLLMALKESLIPYYYSGYFGVDVMIVKQNNKLCFQPCVEINLRNNMGTIALHLQKIIHPESKGTFSIVFDPKDTFENIFPQICKKTEKSDNYMINGTLALISPIGKRFGAYVSVEPIKN